MKIYEILSAVPALNKLSGLDMPLPEAYKLQKLMAALQPDIEFFNDRNTKLIKKYDGKGKGAVEYPEENRAAAQNEFNELLSLDVQTKISCIKIAATENIKLSANDITALIPFVNFVTNGEK